MPHQTLSLRFAYEFADKVAKSLFGLCAEPVEWLTPDDPEFLSRIHKPNKDTLLHSYIRAVNDVDAGYYLRKFPGDFLPYCRSLLNTAGISQPEWLDAYDYLVHQEELDELFELAHAKVADATFQVLYADPEISRQFQDLISELVTKTDRNKAQEIFAPTGAVRRATYLPIWLKNAIFHRDKGRCRKCMVDLTRVINPDTALQFDHVLALASGGTNDPTNFQLLCAACNTAKSARIEPNETPTLHMWW